MQRLRLTASPKHIVQRDPGQPGEGRNRAPQKERNFREALGKTLEEWLFRSRSRHGRMTACGPVLLLPAHPHGRYRIGVFVNQRKSKRVHKFREADAIENAKCEELVNVPRRSITGLTIRERPWRSEVTLVTEIVCHSAAQVRCLPERQTGTQPGGAEESA